MNKKILAIALLTIIIAVTIPVFAEEEVEDPVAIPSGGNIPITATPPVINYKWELTESGQQCADIHDQTICESKFSCIWNTEVCVPTLFEGYYMVDDDCHTPGLQVRPRPCENSGFNTSLKDVRVYIVVSSPYGINDITNVHVKKFYPNDVEKEENDAIDITGVEGGDGHIIPSVEVEHAIAAAVHYGYITEAQAYDPNTGIIEMIKQKQYKVYREIDKMTCCDPAGTYRVMVRVTGRLGAYIEFSNLFQYFSIKAIRTDFATVDYGLIPIGTAADKKWISGDYIFGTPAPTVRNNGNDPWILKIKSTDLINQQNSNYFITVDHLDSWFLGWEIDPLTHDWQSFDAKVLNRCTDTKIDFSVWAPYGTSSGTYAGTITLKPTSTP